MSPGWCWLLPLLALGCGDDGGGDTTPDAGRSGGGDPPMVTPCSADTDCDDGVFCNGAELCMPGASGTNAAGCQGGTEACLPGQRCEEAEQTCVTVCEGDPDADADGHAAMRCGGDDCDDSDPDRFPGNPEVCDDDAHDEDCDPRTFGAEDTDADGFHAARCCNVSEAGLRFCGADCDDDNAVAHPDAPEACDGFDNDCDVSIDEGVSVRGFYDGDFDLHGDPAMPLTACADSARFATEGDDCDDGDPAIHGAQQEFCDGRDNDCDGAVDEEAGAVTWYADSDGDSFGSAVSGSVESCEPPVGHVILGSDCNDRNAAVSPRAAEICDGADNDCDDNTDEDVQLDGFFDGDGDGYGADGSELTGCPGDPGFVVSGGDCDDARVTVHPGRLERCDDLDEDCDGEVDEGLTVMGYADLDRDLHGDANAEPELVCGAVPGISLLNDDCDDGDPAVHAAQPEICDMGVDNDCDGEVDEVAGDATYYVDADGDGFGDPLGEVRIACAAPAGYALLPFDCDDGDGEISPSAVERCDGVDNDCSGVANYRIAPGDLEDDDGDGYADMACGDHGGAGDDCDDGDPDAYPGASEVCDGVDNDCDGAVDEDSVALDWYPDLDRDGYGRDATPVSSCLPVAGRTPRLGDCDDSDPGIKPGRTDECDLVDNDCDGAIDEDAGRLRYYADGDGDGFAGGASVLTCYQPEGYSAVSTDCNDDDIDVYHGAPEFCDGVDQDCDGALDEGVSVAGYADADGDGFGDPDVPAAACVGDIAFALNAGDCDDMDATRHIGAIEICDEIDNDCDMQVDENQAPADWYPDVDNDGFGDAGGVVVTSCDPQGGYSLLSTDCDDGDALTNPIRPELCDAEDNDCDGALDEGLLGRYPELCDGILDEDCDGVVDEGCDCVPNTARFCEGSDVGECQQGIEVCDALGQWSVCLGSRGPTQECCDGRDNDCNGVIDDACVSCAVCGDAEVEDAEVCDNGINMGLYGGCAAGCGARGPHCGDGQLDLGHEECDDGDEVNGNGCDNDCTESVAP